MADEHEYDTLYGHFGPAYYNFDERRWIFGRLQMPRISLKSLCQPQILVDALGPESHVSDSSLPHEPLSKSYERQVRTLTESFAELQPSSHLLGPFARVSESIQRAVPLHNPGEGSLISFSNIYSSRLHRPVSVIALATGTCKSNLLAFRIEIPEQGQKETAQSWTRLPTRLAEEVTWTASHGTIQQVRFRNSSSDANPLLAVRQTKATAFFRLVHSDTSSGLELRSLCSITAEQTNGILQSDVSFNPWFGNQIALIDQRGGWSVLEFQSRRLDKIVQTWKWPPSTESTGGIDMLYDGWARIEWVNSLSTVAACTRRTLALFDISSKNPAMIQGIDFATTAATSCVADMAVLPGRMDMLSVLTSTHIYIYRVVEETSGAPSINSVYQLRHFQNPADLSLRLNSWSEADYHAILVYSRVYQIAWQHICKVSDEGTIQFSEPTRIDVPAIATPTADPPYVTEIVLQPIEAAAAMLFQDHNHPGTTRHAHQPKVYRAYVLCANGLLYSSNHHAIGIEDVDLLKAPLRRPKISHASRCFTRKPHAFIISDDDDSETKRDSSPRREPVSRRTRQPQGLVRRTAKKLLSFEAIAYQLEKGRFEPHQISLALSQMRRLLEEPIAFDIPPLRPLHEYVEGEVTFRDATEAASLLQDVEAHSANLLHFEEEVDTEHEQPWHLTVDTVPLPLFAQTELNEDTKSLNCIYSEMIETWIKSLPADTSMRTRLAKEQLARRIASQIVLARRVIRASQTSEAQPVPQSQDEGQPQSQLTLELPVRTGAPSAQQQPATRVHLALPEIALPTPSPSATPSITTISSNLSSLGGPEIGRLSQYTTFNSSAPLPLPRSLHNVLAHWSVGEDPEAYDWATSLREIAQRDEDADEGLTDKERRRARRRAERHIQRQRHEAAASQAQHAVSSQAIEIVQTASQPSGDHRHRQAQPDSLPPAAGFPSSSQTIDSRSLGASQVVPGRFGGRPPPRKKKRKSGF